MVRIAKQIYQGSNVIPLAAKYPDYNILIFTIYQDIETEKFIDSLGTHGYMYPQLAKLPTESIYQTEEYSNGPLYKILWRTPLVICRADIMSFSLPDSTPIRADSLLRYYKTEIERGANIIDIGGKSNQERRTFSANNIWFSKRQMGENFMDALREHNKGDVYIYYHKPESAYGRYMVIKKTSEEVLVSETGVVKIEKYVKTKPIK